MARTPKIVEDRREQIIDAAMRVFAQKGFAKATNKDVAREAGITPGLIYYYFESKEALLTAIIENRSPLHVLTTLPEQLMSQTPEVFLHFLIQRMLGLVESENFVGLIRVMLPELLHGENQFALQLVTRGLQRGLGIAGMFIEAKMQSGELRRADASMMAQILIGSLVAFVLRRQILQDPIALQYTHEQIADVIVETLLQGMSPR